MPLTEQEELELLELKRKRLGITSGSKPQTEMNVNTNTEQQPKERPSLLSNIISGAGSTLKTEFGLWNKVLDNTEEFAKTLSSKDPGRIGLAALGQTLKTGYDIAGTQAGLVAKGVGGVLEEVGNFISPKMVDKIKEGSRIVDEKTKQAVGKLVNSDIGQNIIKKYESLPSESDIPPDWGKARPITKEFVNSIINIAGSLPLTKASGVAKALGTGEGVIVPTTKEAAIKTALESQAPTKFKEDMLGISKVPEYNPPKELPLIGKKMQKTAESSMNIMLKPTEKDMKNGFDNKYILDSGLLNKTDKTKGDNFEVLQKNIDERFAQKRQELNEALKKDPQSRVDLNKVLQKTIKDIDNVPEKNWGSKETIEKTLKLIKDSNDQLIMDLVKKGDINKEAIFKNIPNNKRKYIESQIESGKATLQDFIKSGVIKINPSDIGVDLSQANLLNRTIGKLGTWTTENGVTYIPPEASTASRVMDMFYHNIKEEIENNSTGDIKNINKDLQKLIAIDRVVERRLPVARRQNPASLGSIIALSNLSNPQYAIPSTGLNLINKIFKEGIGMQKIHDIGTGKTNMPEKLKNILSNTMTAPLGVSSFNSVYDKQNNE